MQHLRFENFVLNSEETNVQQEKQQQTLIPKRILKETAHIVAYGAGPPTSPLLIRPVFASHAVCVAEQEMAFFSTHVSARATTCENITEYQDKVATFGLLVSQ